MQARAYLPPLMLPCVRPWITYPTHPIHPFSESFYSSNTCLTSPLPVVTPFLPRLTSPFFPLANDIFPPDRIPPPGRWGGGTPGTVYGIPSPPNALS